MEFRKALSDYNFIIKDTDQDQPNEETHGARSGRPPNVEFPCRLQGNQDRSPSWHIDVFTNQDAPLSFSVQLLLGLHYIDVTD